MDSLDPPDVPSVPSDASVASEVAFLEKAGTVLLWAGAAILLGGLIGLAAQRLRGTL